MLRVTLSFSKHMDNATFRGIPERKNNINTSALSVGRIIFPHHHLFSFQDQCKCHSWMESYVLRRIQGIAMLCNRSHARLNFWSFQSKSSQDLLRASAKFTIIFRGYRYLFIMELWHFPVSLKIINHCNFLFSHIFLVFPAMLCVLMIKMPC